mgnify:CR=1 FL=1
MKYGGKYSLRQILTEADPPAGPDETSREPASSRFDGKPIVQLNQLGKSKQSYIAPRDWWENQKDEGEVEEIDRQASGDLLGGAIERKRSFTTGEEIPDATVDIIKKIKDEIDGDDELSTKTKEIFYKTFIDNFDSILLGLKARDKWTKKTQAIPEWALPFVNIGQAREDEGAGGTQLGMGELALFVAFSNVEFNKTEDKSPRTDLVADGKIAMHVKASSSEFKKVTFYNVKPDGKHEKTHGLDKPSHWVNVIKSVSGISEPIATTIGKLCMELWMSGTQKFSPSGLTEKILKSPSGSKALNGLQPSQREEVWKAIFDDLSKYTKLYLQDGFDDGCVVIVKKDGSGGTVVIDDQNFYFKSQLARNEMAVGTSQPGSNRYWNEAKTKKQIEDDAAADVKGAASVIWGSLKNSYKPEEWHGLPAAELETAVNNWVDGLYKAVGGLKTNQQYGSIRNKAGKQIIKNILNLGAKAPAPKKGQIKQRMIKILTEPGSSVAAVAGKLKFTLLESNQNNCAQSRLFEWAVK